MCRFMFGVFIERFQLYGNYHWELYSFKILSTVSISKKLDKFKIDRLNIFKHLYTNKVRFAR